MTINRLMGSGGRSRYRSERCPAKKQNEDSVLVGAAARTPPPGFIMVHNKGNSAPCEDSG